MRKLTILLSAVAWLMAMPVMAAVDDVFTYGNLKFKVITENETTKEVQVIRPDASLSGDVVIPDHVTNNTVEYSVAYIKGGEIAEGCAFREMNDITSVTIPYTVYSMEYSAFYHCTGLKYVFNNGNMDKIDGWTFNGCTSLEYCRIPATITEIGEGAFQGSANLEYCVVPATVLKIGQSAFEGCSVLKDLTILGSVELDQYALKDCSALKSIYYCGSTLSLKPTENTYKIFENTNNPVIYTKSSALTAIKNALEGKANWIMNLATDVIPYTPAKEYTTFCRDFDVDFSAATGLKAGVALSSTIDGGKLTFTVKSSVPAGTGVLLKKLDSGEYKLKIAESAPETVDGNLMKGVVCPTAISQTDGGNTNFVLNDGVFKKVSASNNTLAAGKAYLQLPIASSAREISFIFDDETTGISATLYDKGQMTNDIAIYNLNGQRVAQPTKGMYIINGNKVIVK